MDFLFTPEQDEAAELAYFGAKVLHPRALTPLANRNIAVLIRPFGDATSRGTEISRRRTLTGYPVKALSAVTGQALLTVTGNGMLGVPGIAARTFAAVHQEGISVSLISGASPASARTNTWLRGRRRRRARRAECGRGAAATPRRGTRPPAAARGPRTAPGRSPPA